MTNKFKSPAVNEAPDKTIDTSSLTHRQDTRNSIDITKAKQTALVGLLLRKLLTRGQYDKLMWQLLELGTEAKLIAHVMCSERTIESIDVLMCDLAHELFVQPPSSGMSKAYSTIATENETRRFIAGRLRGYLPDEHIEPASAAAAKIFHRGPDSESGGSRNAA
jgi:hypothetical protein